MLTSADKLAYASDYSPETLRAVQAQIMGLVGTSNALIDACSDSDLVELLMAMNDVFLVIISDLSKAVELSQDTTND